MSEGAYTTQTCTRCPPHSVSWAQAPGPQGEKIPEAVPTPSLGSVPLRLALDWSAVSPAYHSSQALFPLRVLLQTTLGSEKGPAQRNQR